MAAQNCVSMPKISQNSAEDAPISPQDVSAQASSDDTEKTSGVPLVAVQYDGMDDPERPSHEEKFMAATNQVTSPEYPHGLKLAAIVVALCLATLLAALDQTIMATAAPKITDHFKSIDDIGCDKVSWRWCFYINLPIGALTVVMIGFLLQVPRLDNAEQLSLWQRIKKLDLIGASLLIPATVCLLLALQWGGTTYPWNDSRIIALFVVGGVLTIAFVYSQSKLGRYYTPFIIGCMALFACGAGLLTTLSIATPYRNNLGYQVLTGFGVGIGFEGGIIAVQTVLSGRDIPVAISVVSFFMTIGGAIFVPISQTVFQNGFLAAIKSLAPQLDGHVFLRAGATQIRTILTDMHEQELLVPVLEAYCHALQHVFWVVTACAIAAVLAASGLEWKSVRKT
ncbi:hypothetical protein KCU95_g12295, partial [Aureobasidium melanogenum]